MLKVTLMIIICTSFFASSNVVYGQFYPEEENNTKPIIDENFTIPEWNSTNVQTYKDDEIDFNINYPSDWTLGDEDTRYNTIASFDSPDGEASVSIRVFPQSSYKSLKEFGNGFKNADADSGADTLIAYYRNSTTLLDGKPAFKAIYLTTYNASLFESAFGNKSSTSKAMFIATLVPEKKSYFAIACFAHPADFDSHRPVFEMMADSLRIYG